MGELISTELGPATASEAPIIARMSRDYIERGLEWRWRTPAILMMIRDAEAVVLCARYREGGGAELQIGSFGIMQYAMDTAHLNLLAVSPRIRRRGIASKVLGWLESTADTAGIKHITLEVRADNSGARNFYRAHGYQDLEYVPKYYGGREAAFRMRHKLR